MTSDFSPVAQWARWHGVSTALLIAAPSSILLAAAACWVGLPLVATSNAIDDQRLQVLGLGISAAGAPLFALPLRPAPAWIEAPSSQLFRRYRLGWFLLLLAALLSCAVASSPLLPPSISAWGEYLPLCLAWFAVSALLVQMCPPALSLAAPLIVVIIHIMRIVPWQANVVMNAELSHVRLFLGVGITLLALCNYALRGPRHAYGNAD